MLGGNDSLYSPTDSHISDIVYRLAFYKEKANNRTIHKTPTNDTMKNAPY